MDARPVNKPNKWLAALLGILGQSLAMLYVGELRWAIVYFLITAAIAVGFFYSLEVAMIASVMQIVLVVAVTVHAYRRAARYPDDKPRPAYSRWYGMLPTVFGFVVFVFGIRAFVVEPFRVPASSMLPTLPVGSHLVVTKWGYGNYGTFGLRLFHGEISAPLTRGDLIVFEFPPDRSLHYIKRLIALPGDKISYSRDKQLSINGVVIPVRNVGSFPIANKLSLPMFQESLMGADYLILMNDKAPSYIASRIHFPASDKCIYDAQGMSCEVPPGHYFTLGDNRDNSADSRIWGFVPADHIVGKVVHIVL